MESSKESLNIRKKSLEEEKEDMEIALKRSREKGSSFISENDLKRSIKRKER